MVTALLFSRSWLVVLLDLVILPVTQVGIRRTAKQMTKLVSVAKSQNIEQIVLNKTFLLSVNFSFKVYIFFSYLVDICPKKFLWEWDQVIAYTQKHDFFFLFKPLCN